MAVAATAVALGLRVPQLVEVRRAADVSGIAVWGWAVASVNNLAWVAFGVWRGDVWLATANAALAAASLAVVAAPFARKQASVRAR